MPIADEPPPVTVAVLLVELHRACARDDARRAGIAEADIERACWTKWRLVERERDRRAVEGDGEQAG